MKIDFDKKKLSKDILQLLKQETNTYSRAGTVTQYVTENHISDVNTYCCIASLEWACAKSTNFEDDIIDFGNTALYWLNKALEIEPDNLVVEQCITDLQKKVKKAEKEISSILKYERENLDEVQSIDHVKELAFYYFSRNEKSKEFAAKGYKMYLYVYEKEKANNDQNAELLYYWNALTSCKYHAEGYESSKPEIDALLNWSFKPQFEIYHDLLSNGFWYVLYDCFEKDDLKKFTTIFHDWVKKMTPYSYKNIPYITSTNILNPISNWLCTKQDADTDILKYIVYNCYERLHKSVLKNEDIVIIKKLSDILI